MKILRSYIVPFISHLFKCIWLFFPGIFFVALGIFAFWLIEPGKDLLIAFAENKAAKVYFFIAITFWVYVSWYSSRIIAYLKSGQQKSKINEIRGTDRERPGDDHFFEIPDSFLQNFPRLIGCAAFLVIELAVLQSPLLKDPLSFGSALWILSGGIFLFIVLNWLAGRIKAHNANVFRWIFTGLFIIFALLLLTVAQKQLFSTRIMSLFWLTLYLHICFLFFINLRRELVNEPEPGNIRKTSRPGLLQRWGASVLRVLRIPIGEWSYFISFNLIGVAGLVIYILAVFKLRVSITIGPLPTVILAFAILLGFSNLITAASVKTKLNFHFFVLLIVLLAPHRETHYVRTISREPAQQRAYLQRQNVYEYFSNWIRNRPEIDSIPDNQYYQVYFVLSNGGASRSAYWTCSVLARLEDSTLQHNGSFSKHLFCLSGTSGGGVGVASFFSLLKNAQRASSPDPRFENSSKHFLQQDFLTFTLARMLGPDFFRYLFFPASSMDRAGALEYSFDHATDTAYYPFHFNIPFDSCVTQKNQPYSLPILCINTTRMQDGNPGIISNITITDSNSYKITDKNFNDRIDVLSLLPDSVDIRLSTAAILGARFPYISPAGRIDQLIPKRHSPLSARDSVRPHYFVDGGYFDNSGAGVVQEMMRAIIDFVRTSNDPVLIRRAKKLQFFVLHITNSPVGDPLIKKSTDLQNDLASPIITILGAYNTQTTVNDLRLENYVRTINNDSCQFVRSAVYYSVNLYTGPGGSSERYPLNWFISQSVLNNMDLRLKNDTGISHLYRLIRSYPY